MTFFTAEIKANIPKPFAAAANYNKEENVELPPHPSSCIHPPVSSCHFCKLNGVEIEIKKENPYMIAAGVDALQVSPPFHTHTHTHTFTRRKRKHTVACSLLRVEARHSWFHSKREEMEKERGE